MKVTRQRTPRPAKQEIETALTGHIDWLRYGVAVNAVGRAAKLHPGTLRAAVFPMVTTDRDVIDVAARVLRDMPGVADIEELPDGDPQRQLRPQVQLHLHRTFEVDVDVPDDPAECPNDRR